jgi:hypothetical protein
VIDLNSPLAAQMLRRIVDEQVNRRLEELLPKVGYGVVDSLPTEGEASVLVQGSLTPSPGWKHPIAATPRVGDRVRLVNRGGDRYIDDSLSALSLVRHGAVLAKTTTFTMTTTSAWGHISGTFDAGIGAFGGAEWDGAGNAAGSIHTTEDGIYLMCLTGRFINATSASRHGIGIYVTATSGGVAGGSTPATWHTDIRSQAATANHYIVMMTVGMVIGDRWWYPMYWQSSSTAHNIDGVQFQILKIAEYPI